jgi:competence protein ComEC
MRRAILAFAAGVFLLQQQARLPSLWWLALVLFCWTIAWRLGKEERVSSRRVAQGFFVAGCAVAGFMWAAALAVVRLNDALPSQWEGRSIAIVGVVAKLPQRTQKGIRFSFDLERVLTPQAHVPRHIQLSWYGLTPAQLPQPTAIHAGDRWQFTVRLKRPHGNANPHAFDYEAWLLEQGTRAVGYVRAEEVAPRWLGAGGSVYGVERARERVRDEMRTRLREAPYAAVLVALAVGDQSGIAQAQWDLFWRTGVGHLISISGLHITMVGSLVLALAYRSWRQFPRLALWIPAQKVALGAGLAAAAGYALLAGMSVPTQRTLLSLAVIALALWRDRQAAPSQVLCFALLAVLVWDPWAVLAIGFWLSFGAVALIFWVSSHRTGRVKWFAAAARTQWAVTVGLLPLLLASFQQVSLISPLANAIAIPVISLAVVPLTLLGSLFGVSFFLQGAHALLSLCVDALNVMSGLPFAVWTTHAVPTWVTLAGLCGALWLLAPAGLPGRWLGALWLAPLVLIAPPRPEEGCAWITTLDVGQGLAMVVLTRHHALVYDTGPAFTAEADSGNRILAPFLRAIGVSALDGLVVSHADQDHSGGAASLLAEVPARWILSSIPDAHPLASGLKSQRPCLQGTSWSWDGVRFDVLHPDALIYASDQAKSNDRGCVLKITTAHGSALLPADIEGAIERELVGRYGEALRADVLVAPHHGSRTSSTEEFLNAVRPRHLAISAGYRNRFQHPNDTVLARYRAAGFHLWRTDQQGALTIRLERDGVSLEAERLSQPRYWYEG